MLVGGLRPVLLTYLRGAVDLGLLRARLTEAGKVRGTQQCVQWQPPWLNHEKTTASWQSKQFSAKLGSRASSLWRGKEAGPVGLEGMLVLW